jgi:hypothetical protein
MVMSKATHEQQFSTAFLHNVFFVIRWLFWVAVCKQCLILLVFLFDVQHLIYWQGQRVCDALF